MAGGTRIGAGGKAPTTQPGAGASPKTRAPGLDGVRALAVLAVMAFHEGLRAAPGGFLGVDIFFVLSGYLITDLLVSHRARHGSLGLGNFWARRARRLLPALAVVLVVVTAAVAVIEPGQMTALRPVLVAAATYSSNWYQALHHVSYFQTFGPPPPLQHLWSLAIEEQFYLVWPLALGAMLTLATRRAQSPGSRRGPVAAAWTAALGSAVLAALLYVPGSDPSRVYYGTDTHATALLVGCALALTWPLASVAAASATVTARLDMLGVAGLVVLAWAVGHFSGTDPAVYPVGLAVAALAAGALVLAATAPGMVSNTLSLAPLRWLGVRSYGIYLWHWPVIALAAAAIGPSSPPGWLWLPESVAAIGLAAVSWRWIEAPILRNGFRAACRSAWDALGSSVSLARWSPASALPAVAAAGALTVACTAGYGVIRPAQASGLQQQIAVGQRISSATQSRSVSAGMALGPSLAGGRNGLQQGSDTALPGRPAMLPGGSAALPAAATPAKVRGSQVTAVGDSVMLAGAQALTAALPGIYIDAQVSRQFSVGLAVVHSLAARGHLRRVVVVGLGTNGTVTSAQVAALLRAIGPDRDLVLVNTFEARPWEAEVNATLMAAARRDPNVVLANWHRAIESRTDLLYPDGVHPMPPGARLYARVVAGAVQATGLPSTSTSARPGLTEGTPASGYIERLARLNVLARLPCGLRAPARLAR
ncbi:MAG TPA: acyltransferase family protein [Streptosporangiaceae bacterium]|nr:acyltransferase family protein [Streptosporangiaceae bacterium]